MRYDETLHNLLTDVGRPFIDYLREPGHQVVQEAWRTATLPDHRQHGRVSEKEETGPQIRGQRQVEPQITVWSRPAHNGIWLLVPWPNVKDVIANNKLVPTVEEAR